MKKYFATLGAMIIALAIFVSLPMIIASWLWVFSWIPAIMIFCALENRIDDM